MYTTVEASKEINMKPDAFRKRAITIGLVARRESGVFMWNDKQQIATVHKIDLNQPR